MGCDGRWAKGEQRFKAPSRSQEEALEHIYQSRYDKIHGLER
jgi:hypothetical protein